MQRLSLQKAGIGILTKGSLIQSAAAPVFVQEQTEIQTPADLHASLSKVV